MEVELTIVRRGYYPRGGGEAVLKVQPVKNLTAVDLTERGDIKEVHVYSYVAGQLPNKLSQEMADSIESSLQKQIGKDVKISKIAKREQAEAAVGTGSGVLSAFLLNSLLLNQTNKEKAKERQNPTG